MEPGTGKTLVTLSLIVDKYMRGKINRVLIIGPKIAKETWVSETIKHVGAPYVFYPDFDKASYNRHNEIQIFDSIQYERKYKSSPYRNAMTPHGDFNTVHERLIFIYLSVHSVSNRIDQIYEYNPDVIVLDESHTIKKASGKNSKAMMRFGSVGLGRYSYLEPKYRYMLTGTPIDQDQHELWAQWRFCNQNLFGNLWTKFREEWCDKAPIYNVQGEPIPHVYKYSIKEKKKKKFSKRMKRYCFVATKKVLNIRDPQYIPHEFEMLPETRNLYDSLKRDLVVEFEGGTLVADSIGAELMKLQQLTSGIVVNDEGETLLIDDTKIKTALSLIELHQEPAVIFCRFTAEKEEIINQLRNKGMYVVEISGKRKDDWNTKWDAVVAQVQAGGLSIDLTRSRHVYFLSRTYSYVDYFQCISRVHRSGQDKWVKIWSIEAKSSIDKLISLMIKYKQSNVKDLFNMLIEDYFSTRK